MTKPFHVAITNMTGARNRGCEALVRSILLGLDQSVGRGKLRISLHTDDAVFDRDVFKGSVDSFVATPRYPSARWPAQAQRAFYRMTRGSKRFPASRDLADVDLVIATGGDVFTSDYGSFARHARVLQAGVPVALLAQTIGPFDKQSEQLFLNSLGSLALCTVRESESLAYLKTLCPGLPVQQTADVAFLLPATPADEIRSLLAREHHFDTGGKRLIGLSVSSGILAYRPDADPETYLREIASFMDALNDKGYSVVLIPHVQERAASNNDMFACREVLRRCTRPQDNLFLANPLLTASDYKGIAGICEALVGARTHATIGAMSQGIPTVAIAYSRKARGIMRDYYGAELGAAVTVEVTALTRDGLLAALTAALDHGRTDDTAARMKELARRNFTAVGEVLGKREGSAGR